MAPEDRGAVGLTVGLVLIITTFAVDALALVAAMPVIESDLGGRQWYGAVFSLFVVSNIVAIVATGQQVGRHTFSSMLTVGLTVFAVGLALGAAAPSMFTLALTRTVQGLGAGILATVTYAIVASRFDDATRPKVLAAMSTAWVVPSLIAPSGAAWVAEQFHWRWVFIILLMMVAPAAGLTIPRLRSVPVPPPESVRRGQLFAAVGVAASIVLLQVGLAASSLVVVASTGVVCVTWLLSSLSKLLPAGSLTGSGVLGGAMLSKLLAGLVFLGTETFIPLALTDIHGHSATVAGLALTAAALTWTIGSWTVARKHEVWSERSMNRIGHLIVAFGVMTTMLITTDVDDSLIIALCAWAFAGFGVGLVFGSVNVVALREAPEGNVGSVSASLQLADVIGFAIASGVGGALIAVGDRSGWQPGRALLIWWGLLVAVSCFAAATSPRDLPHRPRRSAGR
ncbi:MAG: MFS transporter [Actinomycetota bacterium]|nr:MFS transporter [Actinomycetota bacterium]